MEPLEEYKKPVQEEFLDLNAPVPKTKQGFVKICCPSCDSEVPVSDVNIHDKIGKCLPCNIVFPIAEDVSEISNKKIKAQQKVLRPEGIDIFQFGDEMELSFTQEFSWLDWLVFMFSPLLTIIFFGILSETPGAPWMYAAALLPIILGVYYFYLHYKNHKTIIKVDSARMQIIKRPKKFQKDKTYARENVSQLYIQVLAGTKYYYVNMIVDEGFGEKHVRLTSVNSFSKAKYLEQEIERYFNIQDVAVPQESV